MTTPTPGEIKACCAAVYQNGWSSLLLNGLFHPGGPALTRRLAELAGLSPRDVAVDVACGSGETAALLAEEWGCQVVGADLGGWSLYRALGQSEQRGLGPQTSFIQCDAEVLPLATGTATVLFCECSLCTFPHKDQALAEMSRVLAPGGRLALADVFLLPHGLSVDLQDALSWALCLAGALPQEELMDRVRAAGFRIVDIEDHSRALYDILELIWKRLDMAWLAPLLGVEPSGGAIERARKIIARIGEAVEAGDMGYLLLTAHRL